MTSTSRASRPRAARAPAPSSSPRFSPIRCSAASRCRATSWSRSPTTRRRSPTRVARLYAALVELRRQPPAEASDERARAQPAKLGARPYPGRAQPFRLSGGGGGDPGRRARRPAHHRRAAAAAAQGGVRHRGADRAARAARRRQPALRPAPQAADALGAAPAREPHLRPRLPARSGRVPAAARADGRGRGAARRSRPGACST